MDKGHIKRTGMCWVAVFVLILVALVSCNQQTSTSVELTAPTATPTSLPYIVVVPDYLNVRKGPGVERERVGVVAKSDELKLLGAIKDCKWLKIVTPTDIEGWVSANYTSFNLECKRVPVLPAPPALPLELVRPLGSKLCGQLTFEWRRNEVLESTQAYELILWKVDQDPMISGFSPLNALPETIRTVNLNKAAETLPHLLQVGKDYKWGVLLVQRNPYQRIKYLGGGHQFRFECGESGASEPNPATERSLTSGSESTPDTGSTSASVPVLDRPPTPAPAPASGGGAGGGGKRVPHWD
jgi:hypothetical protein